eukprot:921176-Rhodomonas_salina.1
MTSDVTFRVQSPRHSLPVRVAASSVGLEPSDSGLGVMTSLSTAVTVTVTAASLALSAVSSGGVRRHAITVP